MPNGWWRSNSRFRIQGHIHQVNRQSTAALLFCRTHPGIFVPAGPSPVLGTAHQPCFDRVQVNILTFSLYSFTVRNARSKKRCCHNSPEAWRCRLINIIELILMDFITTEIVRGRPGRRSRASDREEIPRRSKRMDEEGAPCGRRAPGSGNLVRPIRCAA